MKKTVKIDKVENGLVILRNGDKWKLKYTFDETKVRLWSSFDEIESESFGLNSGLTNKTRNVHVKAELV